MGLVDLSLTDFAKVLGSDAPDPGGGSAAALSGANGISLTKMVCELTLGKKNTLTTKILLQRSMLKAPLYKLACLQPLTKIPKPSTWFLPFLICQKRLTKTRLLDELPCKRP